jgi:hypothetical protein
MGVVSQVTTSLWRRVPPRFGALAAFCPKLRKSMSGTNSRITAIEAVNRRPKFDPLERCHFIGVPKRFGMVAWLGGASRERTRPPPKVANRVAIHRVRGLVRVNCVGLAMSAACPLIPQQRRESGHPGIVGVGQLKK